MAGFPQAFSDRLSAQFGADTAARVLAGLSAPPSVSIRLNPTRLTALPDGLSGTPVPWSPYGFLLAERPNFTLDPLFHAGCYYVQDSSAMFVGELVRRVLPQFVPGIRVLDLCAAPGGKTTDIAASLREAYGDTFSLLANEVMRARYAVLRSNVRAWGDARVGVVSRDPAAFAAEAGAVDLMVTDVPCSGEGMFRKDLRALAEWSPETVAFCAARQRRILSDAWPVLRDGGILVYATCTFSREENDENVAWIASELGADVLDLGDGGPGILRTEYGYALLPGFVPGEGQYAAVLRKRGGDVGGSDPLKWACIEVPAADNASRNGYPAWDVDRETALRYLHGDAIRLAADAPLGFLTLCYAGHPLGPGKNIGSRVNNLYPKDRRIRMDIPRYDETQ